MSVHIGPHAPSEPSSQSGLAALARAPAQQKTSADKKRQLYLQRHIENLKEIENSGKKDSRFH
jgi:hypothetical protein